jgi:hypothetical protein
MHLIAAGAQAQDTSTEAAGIYTALPVPSTQHWCTEQAGDDPAKIISGRCAIYIACLKDAGLNAIPDRSTVIPEASIASIKKCNQGLYNAARPNPQIKGSNATQIWLTKGVPPGTEAKSFTLPDGFPSPK